MTRRARPHAAASERASRARQQARRTPSPLLRVRERHTGTGTAPRRHHRRLQPHNHAACFRTRARWRWSYVLVFVSIANAIPLGAIATESMSPVPCHDNQCRTRHPSPSSAASWHCTSSSDRAPTRLRAVRPSHRRVATAKPAAPIRDTAANESAPDHKHERQQQSDATTRRRETGARAGATADGTDRSRRTSTRSDSSSHGPMVSPA